MTPDERTRRDRRDGTRRDADDETTPTLQLVRNAEGPEPDPAPTEDVPAPPAVAPGHRSPVDDARELLASADPVAYHRMLSGLVRANHHSVLQALPYNAALEFHDPSCVVVEPKPQGLDTIELYAGAAYPDFEKVLLNAFRDPAVGHLLNSLYHLLFNEGRNVAIVTNHGQIIDIALVGGALILAMCEEGRSFGVLGEHVSVPELADRVNVLVSRMVTTRQAFNIPAIQVLQCGARTFLTVPQTASRRRAKLDSDLVRANNVVARHELDLRMAEGGQMLLMAASGSQDLSLAAGLMQKVRAQWRQRRGFDPGEQDTLHLQPIYDGTISLMLNSRYVLPVAISLDPSAPACALGSLTRVREKEDCHRVMEWIADAHQQATGTPTIYHRQEDDLLTQVRQLVKL